MLGNSNDPQGLPVIDDAFHDEVLRGLERDDVPTRVRSRLQGARNGTLPSSATLTPAELLIVRSHGLRPIATVSATCWLHYGWSWTRGHSEGWGTTLRRLKREAYLAGANAILDVKMRTIPLAIDGSMDFTLVGTAVHVAGFAPSNDPIVATVPALEFVKLMEADVVPTRIAVGADYEWLDGGLGPANLSYEVRAVSELWERVRTRAHQELRSNARSQGNGVLAHVNFSQAFMRELDPQPPLYSARQYLARHIVVATTVDARRAAPLPNDVRIVVDLHAGGEPLTHRTSHHQSYQSNQSEGAI
jgi:hypothetical protein